MGEGFDGFLPDFSAAMCVGEKIIEMADRLLPTDKVVPGTVAKWSFDLDGSTFEIAMTVRRPCPSPP